MTDVSQTGYDYTAVLQPYMPVFYVAFAVSLILTPLMRVLAHRHGVTDDPDGKRKVHTQPIAYLNEFLTFKEGKLYANDRPGLGVTVNMDRMKLLGSITEPGPNRPTYYRPDGSQITW